MALSRDDIARAYQEHGFRVFWRVRRLLGSEAEARDVLQEVFVALLDRRFFMSDPARLGPWLLKVGTNRALNRLRDQRSRERLLDGQRLIDLEEALAPRTPAPITRETVRQLLDRADPPTRELVLAYYFDGYTLPEIAALYGTPVTTAHRRLQGFLAASRALLAGEGVQGGTP